MASSISFGDANAGFQAGVINGSVSTTHVYSPARPETPPSPSAVLPFPRDRDFVERGTILDQVHQRCAVPGPWVALVGLGGVGKSQLTIEYAYRAREQSARTWVFWVYASNAARFEQSYRDIADRVKIPERKDPTADIFQLVHNWLCDSKERWLLVLDNVDDARFLVDVSTVSRSEAVNSRGAPKPLRSYIPHSERGSVLITTRNQDAALELVERRDIITVDPMDEAQARTLFEKKLEGNERKHEDSAGVDELAAALEYMPLAIVQAAAYIVQRGPRCSVRQYLEELKRSERKRTSLLNHNGGQLRRDWEASNSIIVTWQISFEHIQETRPSAADLLSLISFFDRQGIPEELVRTRAPSADVRNEQKLDEDGLESDSDDDTSQSSEGDDEFEEDVATLRSFYFISVETGGTSFEMHALVQLATRKWLDANGRLERWKQQFISNLSAAFPTAHYENWESCRALFPHAKSAAGQKPQEAPSLEEWAMLMYRAAWYAKQIGDVANAESLAVQSMKVRKKVLDPDHEDTLWSIAMVADAYSLGGRYKEAEALEMKVMETRKTKLGDDHPDTLGSMNNLALTYSNQGRWDKAEQLQVQVMKTSKTKLGDDHPYTLSSINNLASTYWNQGLWDKAEQLQVQVMETRKAKLGDDHPDTLTSVANLALTYRDQGRWDKAEKLQVQVVETFKTKLGDDHPYTLASVVNLASTYRNQGRWDKAEELEVQVMETRKAKLGDDHPDTLTSMANLASTYSNQGRWDKAEQLFVQVMKTSKTKLGDDHPYTLTSMNNLASTYMNQGRWDKAEQLQVQVMETRKTKLGDDHPDTLGSMNNLASAYMNQGRWDKAEELFVQVVETFKTKLGDDHPYTLTSMNNLASTYMNQGLWDKAEQLLVQVMETFRTKLGDDHPDTLTSMNNLASTYSNQGLWDKAEQLQVQVVETRKAKLGDDHPSTLGSMNNLAFTWKYQGRDAEAIVLMRECVQSCYRKLGANHPNAISWSATSAEWEAEQTSAIPLAEGSLDEHDEETLAK